MSRHPISFLWDAHTCCTMILNFLEGKTFDDYIESDLLRAAVERKFEIIGEALNQCSRADPELASRVPELRDIVDFRNILIHAYASINNERVWRIAHIALPNLYKNLSKILNEIDADEYFKI